MRERDFLTEFGSSVKTCGAFWYKIRDPIGREVLAGTDHRPFDGFIVARNQFVAVEAKVVHEGGYLQLRPHQYSYLSTVCQFGHPAWILTRVEPIARRACVYMVSITAYQNYLDDHHRSSIPYRDIPFIGIVLERVNVEGKSYWNICPYLSL